METPTSVDQLTIEYSGNQVSYNNVNYYVIKDSGIKESTVTLFVKLKL